MASLHPLIFVECQYLDFITASWFQTSTLTPEGQMVRMTTDTLEIPEQNDPLASLQSLTDDTLFRVCGGRTAHK